MPFPVSFSIFYLGTKFNGCSFVVGSICIGQREKLNTPHTRIVQDVLYNAVDPMLVLYQPFRILVCRHVSDPVDKSRDHPSPSTSAKASKIFTLSI